MLENGDRVWGEAEVFSFSSGLEGGEAPRPSIPRLWVKGHGLAPSNALEPVQSTCGRLDKGSVRDNGRLTMQYAVEGGVSMQ